MEWLHKLSCNHYYLSRGNLVMDVSSKTVCPGFQASTASRIGRVSGDDNSFPAFRSSSTSSRTYSANAVADFAQTAHKHGTRSIRVIATSAARDAVNPEDLISAIEAASGLKVGIISGGQEAVWAFQGVTTDPELARAPLLLLDVGGGSTEFILGRG